MKKKFKTGDFVVRNNKPSEYFSIEPGTKWHVFRYNAMRDDLIFVTKRKNSLKEYYMLEEMCFDKLPVVKRKEPSWL